MIPADDFVARPVRMNPPHLAVRLIEGGESFPWGGGMQLRELIVLAIVGVLTTVAAAEPTAAQRDFFENRIRPVLVEACYECHSAAGKAEGGLALDSRDGLRKGGDRGPGIVLGKSADSLLVQAIKHQDDDLRMPKGGPKIKDAVVADFAKWIDDGAFDPRDKPPSAEDLARETSWEKIRERRKAWWSFQPVKVLPPPEVANPRWNAHPVDRFLFAAQTKEGLAPSAPAAPEVLLRRVTLLLTGLPPTEEEVRAFVADSSPAAYARVVDRLLASPRFGERWARHWMDWVRYAESHGSEGDPSIPHAYRYRDYLIRAWNDDVPYNQLVREHLAGDLLPNPRINTDEGVRESALGIGWLRMVLHGYAPTDALDEQVRTVDNQIDTLSKAFLGLTVACARCHHHKFDAISQQDFYALYGVLASCRPGVIQVDSPERAAKNRAALAELKPRIKTQLADAWATAAENLAIELAAGDVKDEPLLKLWAAARDLSGDALAAEWAKHVVEAEQTQREKERFEKLPFPLRWKLGGDDYLRWYKSGGGLPAAAKKAGEFALQTDGDQVVRNLYPAGVLTHSLSTKYGGVLSSPRFKIECDEFCVRVAGGKNARVRYVVQNYPRVVLIYPHAQIETETARWFRFDARYWKGEHAHVEIVTGDDQPIDIGSDNGRSWFAAYEVIGRNHTDPAVQETPPSFLAALPPEEWKTPPKSRAELVAKYAAAVQAAVTAWRNDQLTDAQAELLGAFVRRGLLPNRLADVPAAKDLVAEYRRLESEVPTPIRAPGLHEGQPFDQPLFERGDHRKPLAAVPRAYLEAFDARPLSAANSGRLELAEKLVDPKNPFVARVIVNRIWHHLFGRGLVATTDNFGRLGEEPTHPELLDHLAGRFAGLPASGEPPFAPWSLKGLIRHLVLSQAFQQDSRATAEEKDPTNRLLTYFPIRRLEAEAIRDSLIVTAAGVLDETRGGPSVGGNSRRRSVYIRVQRNNLDPFLAAFDAPEPAMTIGRRDQTNVPAQSLTLLNDPFVIDLAKVWGDRIRADKTLTTDADRVKKMFFAAAGREATPREVERALAFLNASSVEQAQTQREIARLQGEIETHRQAIATVLDPVRAKLAAERGGKIATGPQPTARWAFDDNLRDSIGNLHAELQGRKDGAALQGGGLILDGKRYAVTPALDKPIAAKTLEAWIQLDTLDQRGGGALSLETPDGAVFDGLVFGEQEPRRWMSGSDFFRRTKPAGGENESAATERPVHVAITYTADGAITLYRDGKAYGAPYKTEGPVKFDAGKSRILFGLRHSPANDGKLLRGKVLEARFYDRALSAEEVAASAASLGEFLTTAQLLAAVSPERQAAVAKAQAEIRAAEEGLQKLALPEWEADPGRKWRDLAQSLFSWKEFLYVR